MTRIMLSFINTVHKVVNNVVFVDDFVSLEDINDSGILMCISEHQYGGGSR